MRSSRSNIVALMVLIILDRHGNGFSFESFKKYFLYCKMKNNAMYAMGFLKEMLKHT